jgi:hypothetical protein
MADLGYYVRHPASSTTGAASWFDDDRPLGAGRFQIIYGSNALHLLRENPLRTLGAHPGSLNGIWRTTATGTTGATPSSVQWGRAPGDGVLLVDWGVHHVTRVGDTASWPRLRCDFRWAPEDGGDTLGAVLVVVPVSSWAGSTVPIVLPTSSEYYDATTYTGSTSYADASLTVALTDTLLAPMHTAPAAGYPPVEPDEQGERFAFRALLGFYNTSDQNAVGRRGSALGLSLFLE